MRRLDKHDLKYVAELLANHWQRWKAADKVVEKQIKYTIRQVRMDRWLKYVPYFGRESRERIAEDVRVTEEMKRFVTLDEKNGFWTK